MAKHFPVLLKMTDLYIQKGQLNPSIRNTNKMILIHIIIKWKKGTLHTEEQRYEQ